MLCVVCCVFVGDSVVVVCGVVLCGVVRVPTGVDDDGAGAEAEADERSVSSAASARAAAAEGASLRSSSTLRFMV